MSPSQRVEIDERKYRILKYKDIFIFQFLSCSVTLVVLLGIDLREFLSQYQLAQTTMCVYVCVCVCLCVYMTCIRVCVEDTRDISYNLYIYLFRVHGVYIISKFHTRPFLHFVRLLSD